MGFNRLLFLVFREHHRLRYSDANSDPDTHPNSDAYTNPNYDAYSNSYAHTNSNAYSEPDSSDRYQRGESCDLAATGEPQL